MFETFRIIYHNNKDNKKTTKISRKIRREKNICLTCACTVSSSTSYLPYSDNLKCRYFPVANLLKQMFTNYVHRQSGIEAAQIIER